MKIPRLDWDNYNMMLACMTSLRSPDPNTQVGAYICGHDNRPLGLGYNGLPKGIEVGDISWERENIDPLKTKYPYIVHAERNAILNMKERVAYSKLFVTLFPCSECAKEIIQADIKEVHYLQCLYPNLPETKASEWMLRKVGIKIIQHSWDEVTVRENLGRMILKLMPNVVK